MQVPINPFVVFHVIQKQIFGKYALVLMRKMSRLQNNAAALKKGRKLHVPPAHVLIGVLLGSGRLFALYCVAGRLSSSTPVLLSTGLISARAWRGESVCKQDSGAWDLAWLSSRELQLRT